MKKRNQKNGLNITNKGNFLSSEDYYNILAWGGGVTNPDMMNFFDQYKDVIHPNNDTQNSNYNPNNLSTNRNYNIANALTEDINNLINNSYTPPNNTYGSSVDANSIGKTVGNIGTAVGSMFGPIGSIVGASAGVMAGLGAKAYNSGAKLNDQEINKYNNNINRGINLNTNNLSSLNDSFSNYGNLNKTSFSQLGGNDLSLKNNWKTYAGMLMAPSSFISNANFVGKLFNRKNAYKQRDRINKQVDIYNNNLSNLYDTSATNLINRQNRFDNANMSAYGGGINIKDSKKGTFTTAATKHNKSVQEFARQVLANKENYSPAMVKKANFARNAANWHAYGGELWNNDTQYGDANIYKTGGTVNTGNNRDNLTYIAAKLKSYGYNDNMIKGIITNIKAENNGKSGPHGNGAYGLVGWRGSRFNELKNFAKQRGTSWEDLDTQIDFIHTELNSSENKALKYLAASGNAKEAAYNFAKYYERPGEAESKRRGGINYVPTGVNNYLNNIKQQKLYAKSLDQQEPQQDNNQQQAIDAAIQSLQLQQQYQQDNYQDITEEPQNDEQNNTQQSSQLLPQSAFNIPINKSAYGGGIFSYGGNLFPEGGQLNYQHGGEYNDGIEIFNGGGTHEQNPYGGVQQGVDQNGKPNLVEEGEVKFNNYIFSNRLGLDKKLLDQVKLPKKYANYSFAKAAEDIQKEYAEKPTDPINARGTNANLEKLKAAQEALKQMQAQQEAMKQQQAMQEQQAMQQQYDDGQIPEEEEYAYGGNLFPDGGGLRPTMNVTIGNRNFTATRIPGTTYYRDNQNGNIIPYYSDNSRNTRSSVALAASKKMPLKTDADMARIKKYRQPTASNPYDQNDSNFNSTWKNQQKKDNEYIRNRDIEKNENDLKWLKRYKTAAEIGSMFIPAGEGVTIASGAGRYLIQHGLKQTGKKVVKKIAETGAKNIAKKAAKSAATTAFISLPDIAQAAASDAVDHDYSEAGDLTHTILTSGLGILAATELGRGFYNIKKLNKWGKYANLNPEEVNIIKNLVKRNKKAKQSTENIASQIYGRLKHDNIYNKNNEKRTEKLANWLAKNPNLTTKSGRRKATLLPISIGIGATALGSAVGNVPAISNYIKDAPTTIPSTFDYFSDWKNGHKQDKANSNYALGGELNDYNDLNNSNYFDGGGYSYADKKHPINYNNNNIDFIKLYAEDSDYKKAYKYVVRNWDNPEVQEWIQKYYIPSVEQYNKNRGYEGNFTVSKDQFIKGTLDKHYGGMHEGILNNIKYLPETFNIKKIDPLEPNPYEQEHPIIPIEENKKVSNTEKIEPLSTLERYVPAAGGLLGYLDTISRGKNYKNADIIANTNIPSRRIHYNPINEYVQYMPIDNTYEANQANNQATAARQSLIDLYNGNRGAAAVALANLNYATTVGTGDMYNKATTNNFERLLNAQNFNRATDQSNSSGFLEADKTNLQAGLSADELRLKAAMANAEMRQNIDNAYETEKGANLTNFFNSIGNIGRENFNANQIASNKALYYHPMLSNGTYYYDNNTNTKAEGGQINTIDDLFNGLFKDIK